MATYLGHTGDGMIRQEDLRRLRERIGVQHPLRLWNTEASVDAITGKVHSQGSALVHLPRREPGSTAVGVTA